MTPRHLLTFAASALPAEQAGAWTFAPLPVCTISETQAGLDIAVTFDPETAIYGLRVMRPAGCAVPIPEPHRKGSSRAP